MALFRSRSPDRDKTTDRSLIEPIAKAIDHALKSAEAEHVGLTKRLEDATARAGLLVGTESDEHLSRESRDTNRLDAYEAEMRNASTRLQDLNQTIAHLKFLRASFLTRFPDIGP